MSGTYLALAGMLLKQRELEIVSNNLANANSAGFKQTKMGFATILEETIDGSDPVAVTSLDEIAVTKVDFSPGSFVRTDNAFDVAIQGDGFFEIQSPEGVRYSRQGQFSLSNDGTLVNLNGFPINGVAGAIRLSSPGPVTITQDGSVLADGEEVGQLKLLSFEDPSQLLSRGGSLYEAPSGVPSTPVNPPRVIQGMYEESNVSTIANLVKLVEVSRQHETFQKVISEAGGDGESVSSLGRV